MKSIRCFSLLVAVLLSAALLFFLPGFMDTADPSPRKEEASRQFQGELSSIQPQDEAPAGAIEQGETNTGAMPKFFEIPYRRPDMTAITERYEALIAALEADKLSEDEAISQLEQVYSLYDDFYTMQAVADLRYYHDVTDSFYAVESDWFLENEPKMDQLFDELCSASANCALAETLDSRFWGDWVVDSYGGRTSSTLDPAFLALAKQENAALSDYRHAAADPTIQWKGKERSYWDLQEDATISRREWAEIRSLYYDKYAPIFGEIYLRLVRVRQEIAAYLGLDSYEQYAYALLYGRDFTSAKAEELLHSIRTDIAPLYDELSLNRRWDSLRYTEVNEQEILAALRTAARKMGGVIDSAFRDMVSYELYDIDISEKKGDVSYQCYLYTYDNPFVFLKTEGFSDDILNFGHEFGHFVDAWYNHDATSSHDLSEVFSQGMEYLLLTRLPKNYRKELTEYKLLDTADTFTQQGSYAAFEQAVYARPAADWTPEQLNSLSLRLAKEYGYFQPGDEDYYAKSWIDVSHFFDSPFYVIGYCVSNIAACQLYALECEQEGKGLDAWNQMLPRNYDNFLDTVIKQGGLDDPFSADGMKKIAALLREKLQ